LRARTFRLRLRGCKEEFPGCVAKVSCPQFCDGSHEGEAAAPFPEGFAICFGPGIYG
jgi:hypothetical protein